MTVIFRSVGSKLVGKTAKEIAKKAATTAVTKAATKTGEHLGNRAGYKIIELLSKKQQTSKPVDQPLTDFEIKQRLDRILARGRIRKNLEKVKII